MKIISKIEKLTDEWENENCPEYFYVIHEEGADVQTGEYYDTEEEADEAYAELDEEERY